MNHEAKKVLDSRMEEVKRLGGEDAYRLHALQHLQLKTVVKESHSSPVHALCFNHTAPGLQNLFATVGRDQATVYDDQHMADHLGVVVHLHNQPSQHAPGGELQAACWLSAEGWSPHPHGDALLVVSGGDANISVISAVEARVVVLLRGHDKEVVELAGAAGQPGLLASLSRDGNLRLWDAREEACLSSVQADATCMALAPDGGAVVVGTARGRLVRYEVGVNEQGRRSIREGSKAELQLQGTTHSEVVDCIRFLPGNLLATKSGDGRMFVWCLDAMKAVAAWKVPGCSPSGGFNSRCQFAATPDGKYISVGNTVGDCYVFDAASGARVAHLSPIKISAPVRACGLSTDCRHLLAALGNGFIFRYEYLGEQQAQQEEAGEGSEGNKADSDAENADANTLAAAAGGA